MPIKFLTFAMLALFLAACSRLTVENYDKLETGMRYEEVKNILGKPDKCSDVMGMKNCTWGDEKRGIHVSFVGDQVVLFAAEGLQ